MAIANAILRRWSESLLDVSIGMLYRGPDKDAFGATPEDIAEFELPRAEFTTGVDEPTEYAIGFSLRSSTVTFRVYSKGDEIEDHMDSIESMIHNSELALIDPLRLDDVEEGIVTMQLSGRSSYPVDKNVACGEVDFMLTWQKPDSIPS